MASPTPPQPRSKCSQPRHSRTRAAAHARAAARGDLGSNFLAREASASFVSRRLSMSAAIAFAIDSVWRPQQIQVAPPLCEHYVVQLPQRLGAHVVDDRRPGITASWSTSGPRPTLAKCESASSARTRACLSSSGSPPRSPRACRRRRRGRSCALGISTPSACSSSGSNRFRLVYRRLCARTRRWRQASRNPMGGAHRAPCVQEMPIPL